MKRGAGRFGTRQAAGRSVRSTTSQSRASDFTEDTPYSMLSFGDTSAMGDN